MVMRKRIQKGVGIDSFHKSRNLERKYYCSPPFLNSFIGESNWIAIRKEL